MGYAIDTLKTDVRKLLDEQGANDSGFANSGSTDTNAEVDDTELNNLIELYAPEARNFVLSGCDSGLLEKEVTRSSAIITSQSTQSNVLRLVRATNSTWKRDVTEFIDKGSKDASMLEDSISCGTIWSPKVAFSFDGSTTVNLKFSPSPTGGTTYLYYVSATAVNSSNLNVEGVLLQAAVRHYIAGLVCQSMGDSRADGFFQMAMNYMGVGRKEG